MQICKSLSYPEHFPIKYSQKREIRSSNKLKDIPWGGRVHINWAGVKTVTGLRFKYTQQWPEAAQLQNSLCHIMTKWDVVDNAQFELIMLRCSENYYHIGRVCKRTEQVTWVFTAKLCLISCWHSCSFAFCHRHAHLASQEGERIQLF